MNNDRMRSDIAKRFERVDNELSKFKKISKYWMYGCATGVLLNVTKMAVLGVNMPDAMNMIGLGAYTGLAYMAKKSIITSKQNRELYDVIDARGKQIPQTFYDNIKTEQLVLMIMVGSAVLGLGAWMIGKMSAANMIFLGGCAGLACMVYEYNLSKQNRKILSAELPKGVIDEHTR